MYFYHIHVDTKSFEKIHQVEENGGAKNDFGGIRIHAQKTAALTQRLRPLSHEVFTVITFITSKSVNYLIFYDSVGVGLG